jgi:hypothetical protein
MKNVISQFINTALIIYIINYLSQGFKSKKYLANEGLVLQVTDLVVFSGLIDVALNIVHQGHIFKSIKNWYNYKHINNKSHKINMLQIDLNE